MWLGQTQPAIQYGKISVGREEPRAELRADLNILTDTIFRFTITAQQKEYFGDCEPKLIIKLDGALFYMNAERIKSAIEGEIEESSFR